MVQMNLRPGCGRRNGTRTIKAVSVKHTAVSLASLADKDSVDEIYGSTCIDDGRALLEDYESEAQIRISTSGHSSHARSHLKHCASLLIVPHCDWFPSVNR